MDEGKNKFSLLSSKVFIMVTNELYNKFTNEGIDELSAIPEEKKLLYYKATGSYSINTTERIVMSKSIYVMELITSTF